MVHTPGPWRRTTYNDLPWVGSDTELGGLVCSLVGVSPADADLIMSAPALAAENARLREALETTAHELRVRNRYSLQHGAYLLAVEVLASVGVEWARAALAGEA